MLSDKRTPQADETLVRLFVCDGDREAFAELYRRYQNIVYSKAFSMIRDEQSACDATHDIFVKLFFALPSFRGDSSFKTWLYRIVHNSCVSVIRCRKKHATESVVEAESYDCPGDDDAAQAFTARFDEEKVRQVLLRLSPEETEILLLRYDDELSVRQMAAILDIGVSAVKMRLSRAKNRFRKVYEADSTTVIPPTEDHAVCVLTGHPLYAL